MNDIGEHLQIRISNKTRSAKNIPSRFLKNVLWVCLLLCTLTGCGGSSGESREESSPPAPTRTWEMGFFTTSPRPTVDDTVRTIDTFSDRAELAAIHEELPWTDLIDGVSIDDILQNKKQGLVNYIRSKGLRLYFMADLTDGLSRGEEAPQLRRLGRSITEPAIRQLYTAYVRAFVARFHPEYIGLAAETNLIRQAAQIELYSAVVTAANDAATALHGDGITAPLLVSVQVETAWGGLGISGSYAGVETDFAAFPFIDILGLSSYPYFNYARPEDIPDNYYSRLLNGRTIPVMVCEGGWTSASVVSVISTPDIQASYIRRHADLLDSVNARATVQTLFADIDISSLPNPLPPTLPLFISIGLMSKDFQDKPALSRWDELFDREKR